MKKKEKGQKRWDLMKRMDELDLKQKDLAEKSGISKAFISGLVNGWYMPKPEEIPVLKEILGKDFEKLL